MLLHAERLVSNNIKCFEFAHTSSMLTRAFDEEIFPAFGVPNTCMWMPIVDNVVCDGERVGQRRRTGSCWR